MNLLLTDLGDGGEFNFNGIDFKIDDTLYTPIYLSLFDGDSFSNIYKKYKSDESFEKALNKPVTLANLQNAQTKAYNLLQWLLDEGIATEIKVFAYGSKDSKINVDITIKEPDSIENKYSVFWENERFYLKGI